MVELEAGEHGDVGIVVFGLQPRVIGQGLGGWFLTMVSQPLPA
jgi:hypothetical protein